MGVISRELSPGFAHTLRDGEVVSHLTHNQEFVSSSLTPATTTRGWGRRPPPHPTFSLTKMMDTSQTYSDVHNLDRDKNPAGGSSRGIGYTVTWQNGALGRGEDRKPQNGAFVEDIILVAIARVEFYQRTKFACPQNDETLKHLKAAFASMQKRTAEREERSVEGTHEV